MKLQNIPNEVFGLAINDNFYRAVKIESLDCENKLFLLDVGENYSVTDCSMDIYKLSNECKNLPAQAILCKMETVNIYAIDWFSFIKTIFFLERCNNFCTK